MTYLSNQERISLLMMRGWGIVSDSTMK